ncbi:hypothetical protein GGS24DRAFT_147392 [Hypoxylon argillaceum]|nr:hypothetical protein GGS24DRAFT_147392 [Hypoxylon argillaceum]
MADTIRGAGLFIAHNALATLVEDPQRLDRMRGRFSKTPPSYQSHSSGTSTRSQSLNPPSEEQQRREWRQAQLIMKHPASRPSSQFDAQVNEQCRRTYKERYPTDSPSRFWAPGPTLERPAAEIVKKRWIEQGIWKDKWNSEDKPSGPWKHEEPLEPESEFKTDSESETVSIFSSKPRKSPTRRRKGSEEIRQIAERRPALERQRQASRPYHQFLWQVSQERERIQDEQGVGGAPADDLADVNTRAYERIKSRWMAWKIWHSKWGVLPGMWWQHERSLEEFFASDPLLAQASEPEDHGHEAIETPPRLTYGPFGLFNGPLTGLQNSNPDPLSSSPRSQRLAQSRPESSRTVQPPLQSTSAMQDDQPEEHASLAPVNPSSVTKARKRAPSLRRLRDASGEPSSSAPVPPRRSKRLQEAKLNAAQETVGIDFTDSMKDKAPSRKRGTRAGKPKTASSAKPQGISKKPRLSTTQQRASRSN